jgi:transposase
MVVIGIDAHKRSHTAVAVDGNGTEVGSKTVAATAAGHLELVRWAAGFGERRFAVEDCRHLTRNLERDLLRAGEAIVRVPPKLMAGSRRAARTRGKSDPIDALAVARAALREPDLPVARLDGSEREVRLLLDHRDDLVAERTRCLNRLRWHLHELDPVMDSSAGDLTAVKNLDALAGRLASRGGLVAEIALELVARCREITLRERVLERRIAQLIAPLAPSLLELEGCGVLSAAKIVGETAGVDRFRDRNAFARHNGTAPIPVWSGNSDHHRLNRGGNRQLNAAIHRIAITQLRRPGPARDTYERLTASGKTKRDALRIIRRRLSDIIYRRLLEDSRARSAPTVLADAA